MYRYLVQIGTRAVDPHSFSADPYLAVLFNADPNPALQNLGMTLNFVKKFYEKLRILLRLTTISPNTRFLLLPNLIDFNKL